MKIYTNEEMKEVLLNIAVTMAQKGSPTITSEIDFNGRKGFVNVQIGERN